VSTDLTVEECRRAEALWAQLADAAQAAVPEYGQLSYAEDLREAQRRIGLASLAVEAGLAEEERSLLERWQVEVQIPGVVLAGLLDGMASAEDDDRLALCLLVEE
jgi:hypothetical protein